MTKRLQISRRTFLRGTGATLGLPLLEIMDADAAEAKPPTRCAALYLPNGCPPDAWRPQQNTGPIESLSKEMAPLEPFRKQLQIITGLQSELNGSHPAAGATWLVRPAPEGDRIDSRRQVGVSMDQILAKTIGQQTRLPSLELSLRPEGSFSKSMLRNNISWSSPTTPVPRETDPRAVFDRLAGRGKASNSKSRDDRQSILDTVAEDARDLQRRVSIADRDKLNEYFDAVRSVERQLAQARQQSTSLAQQRLKTVTPPPSTTPDDHKAYLRLMFDMLVLAFWTDSTRVSTFMLDHEQSNRYFNFLPGVKGMWHALSHWGDISGRTEDDDGKTSWSSRAVKRKQYLSVITYHHQQVAYFLQRLSRIQEQGGSLLDHSMILYGSPFADGHEHDSKEIPVMLAGGGGGRLTTGWHQRHPSAQFEGLFISMLDIMGTRVEKFGGTDKAIPIWRQS